MSSEYQRQGGSFFWENADNMGIPFPLKYLPKEMMVSSGALMIAVEWVLSQVNWCFCFFIFRCQEDKCGNHKRLGLATSEAAKIGSGRRQKLLRHSSGSRHSFKPWWPKYYFLTFKFLSLVFLVYHTSNFDIKFMEDMQNLRKVIITNVWQIYGYHWRPF